MTEPLYADDPDVHVVFPITDGSAQTIGFTPTVRGDGIEDILGEWISDPGPVRDLKVPLTSLSAGFMYFLRLVVPDDVDLDLGYVILE